jgi:hypothetical protein
MTISATSSSCTSCGTHNYNPAKAQQTQESSSTNQPEDSVQISAKALDKLKGTDTDDSGN